MLVKDKRTKGDQSTTLSNYEGKMLEWLCPRVEPLLDKDPSHPGKLEAFKKTINSACHDSTPPGPSEMTHICGDIRHLVKKYLGR